MAAARLGAACKALEAAQNLPAGDGLFKAWCEAKGVSALPASPETVAAFLAAETGNGTKPSTLGRRVAAIRYAHKLAHLECHRLQSSVLARTRSSPGFPTP